MSDPGPNGLLVCHSGYQETETLANSEYPDEMSHNVLTGLAQAWKVHVIEFKGLSLESTGKSPKKSWKVLEFYYFL